MSRKPPLTPATPTTPIAQTTTARATDAPVRLQADEPQIDTPPERNRTLALTVLGVIGCIAAVSLVVVFRAIHALPSRPDRWPLQLAIFCCVATLPQFWIEYTARLAEKLTHEIPLEQRSRWFENTGAFVGLVERPLLFGSILAQHPEFIGVWLVFKGIAGYRLGLKDQEVLERRVFQLHLLNTASSLGGVALGWLVWSLLRLPTMAK